MSLLFLWVSQWHDRRRAKLLAEAQRHAVAATIEQLVGVATSARDELD